MNLQTIKSINGKIGYVFLPVVTYHTLRDEISKQLKLNQLHEDYETFNPADYVENPVALARIQAGIAQEELTKRMNVTQAYISKIERQTKITAKIMQKVKNALLASNIDI